MGELVMGRDPSADFPINEFVISRKHAKISKRWGGIVIRDLESKNGTFINNRRIVEEFLHDGDRIAMGTIVLMFRNPQEINLAQFSQKIPPKRTPARIEPQDIPIPEEEGAPPGEMPPEEAAPEEEAAPAEEESPLETWGATEERPRPAPYPLHMPRQSLLKRFSPVEIGMVGLGALVLIFAFITIVNLIFE
jgi:hypothetical protein